MFTIFKNEDSAGESPKVVTSGYSQWDCDIVIDFDTLNTLTKDYYSPQARVKRMLQHAKIAAEKGSWWCNIPEVGEEEITLLKGYGFRVFRKESQTDYQYSLNWSDKSVTPKDTSLVEL